VARELAFDRDAVHIAGLDFGGTGPGFLLLHGLAGTSAEWTETGGWLAERGRVVALDARGHGASERFPADVSREAHVADAAFVIEQLDLGPAVVIGHSLGGQAAMLLAAARPDLVGAVVVAEGGPNDNSDVKAITGAVDYIDATLRRWPVPFATRAAALTHFGGPSLRAELWTSGLEQRDDGLWPRFDIDVMLRTLRASLEYPSWDAWERVEQAMLLVRANRGIYTAGQVREMAERGRAVTLVEIDGAGHDVHLDRPREWRAALSDFLDSQAS
jgi:pimeloyl-ACP methyl ester carboxylesterase